MKFYEWCCLKLHFFLPSYAACGILVPNWGLGPSVEAPPTHWTAGNSLSCVCGGKVPVLMVTAEVLGSGCPFPRTLTMSSHRNQNRLHAEQTRGESSHSLPPWKSLGTSPSTFTGYSEVSGQRGGCEGRCWQYTRIPAFLGLLSGRVPEG